MKIKPAGKVVILIIILGVAFGGWRLWKQNGEGLLSAIAPEGRTRASGVPLKADLPDVNPVLAGAAIKDMRLPGDEPGCTDKPEVRFLHWAWNSQMGLMFANGGKQATSGSLMCGKGVNLKLIRQDDPAKMQEALVAFATELSQGNPQPSNGAHFVAIMGDGAASFLAGLNSTLRRIGPEYTAKIVGSCGYSRGEDKFMGPPSWKSNPAASRGGVVAGYLRDGDWNIAMKWLADNGLKNNPDEKTWDPDALNWIAANDYIDAAEKYITGYTETRPVVRNGRRTGETKKITVQGVVTWTPGDVSVAEKKGGLVSIVSTKEYSSQMPNTIIGIDKWMRNNRPLVEGMLHAITEGGDAVKASSAALDHAAEVSAIVYNEQGADANYWKRYYKGTVERDKQGLMVELGGSYVNNLADNLITFGLVPGSANLFAATYKVFGDIVVDQYPDLVPNYPPVHQVLDTSYLQAVAKRVAPTKEAIAASTPTYTPPTNNRSVVSRRAWNIPFESGKATFSPSAKAALEKLRQDLLVASGTTIEIHGHTDSQGAPDKNMSLSEERAFAVQKWLEKTFPVNFPRGRTRVFAHGQTNPV
ncbi:MAG TPA: OmpA family protein, partial [Fimbriimonadaceae bacterium]|nr:OmpA family protein [Fimbriimonadaceae bacterium]